MKGGYRENSGRSKSGYYKGLYCASTYELCWVIYNLDHGIKFKRFPNKLEKNGTVYYPDFLLDDDTTIVEIKGYEDKNRVDIKTKLAESFGYTVKVLRKDDLKDVFNYVKKIYKTNKFYTLYDNYKPLYEYTCSFCKQQFKKDRKIVTKTRFCNRKCAGKYVKSYMSDEIKDKISKTLKSVFFKRGSFTFKRSYKQIWITNGVINTRINFGKQIPDGFRRGRTIQTADK